LSELKTPDEEGTSSREELPIFRTEPNRASLMAIYDERLRHWPVPFETFLVATRYGIERQLVASVAGIDLQREAGVRVPGQTSERRRRELQVSREHRRERVPKRVPREPV
jgi:hypothetical protein